MSCDSRMCQNIQGLFLKHACFDLELCVSFAMLIRENFMVPFCINKMVVVVVAGCFVAIVALIWLSGWAWMMSGGFANRHVPAQSQHNEFRVAYAQTASRCQNDIKVCFCAILLDQDCHSCMRVKV